MTSSAGRLASLHAAAFLLTGIYMPFFPVWLESRGLSSSAIGAILAVPMLTRVVVTTPILSLADGPLGVRRVLLASYAALALFFAALLAAPGPVAIAAVLALTAVAQAPLMPLNDLVTMQAVRERPGLHYGAIRVWGSISFLGASVGGGFLVAADADAVVLLLAAIPALGFLATLRALPPDAPRPPAPRAAGPSSPPPRLRGGLWLVMAAGACIQASHAALYAFGSIHWQALGFSEPTVGALWAWGVVAEIALFAALGRGARTASGAVRLLAIGAVAATVRTVSLAFTDSLPLTFALQSLHAFSFAATHIGTLALVSGLAPEGARGRAQGWMTTLIASATALSTVASGVLYRAAGPLAFAAMAPLALAGLALALAGSRALAASKEAAPAEGPLGRGVGEGD